MPASDVSGTAAELNDEPVVRNKHQYRLLLEEFTKQSAAPERFISSPIIFLWLIGSVVHVMISTLLVFGKTVPSYAVLYF